MCETAGGAVEFLNVVLEFGCLRGPSFCFLLSLTVDGEAF